MLNKTSSRRMGGIAVSVAIVCAGSAMVASAFIANPGSATESLPVPKTAVPAGDYVSVCPDPAHLLKGAMAGTDAEFSPKSETAKSAVTAVVLNNATGSIPGSAISGLGSGDRLRTIAEGVDAPAGPDETDKPSEGDVRGDLSAAVVPSEGVNEAVVLRAHPLGQQEAAAGAVLTYSAKDGDLRGLAAANCQRPANDLWLLGANTTIGQTALLNIYNPSSTPATVDLELFGADGPIDAAGSRGILVPPGQSESVVLGGLAPDRGQLAVHVHSTGGSVTANIQQSALRDLVPGGVEYLSPGSGPSTRQVVTGVRIQGEETAAEISGQAGYASASPVLQLAVPGTAEAVVKVQVFGPDGEEPLAEGKVLTVPGETMREIPLSGLPKGTYTVVAISDVSVAATARLSKGIKTGEPVDMGFSGSVDRMGSRHVIPVASGVDAKLVFGAPFRDAEVELIPINADGEPGESRTVNIAAGTTEQLPVGGEGAVAFVASASGGAVYGAQLLTDDGKADIAVVPVPEAVNGERSLPVSIGY